MLPGLVIIFDVLCPVSPAVPIFYQRMADGIREAHGRAVGSRVGHLSDSGAELVKPRSVVIALFQVSREASSDIVGGTGKRVEVHHVAMSTFVLVVHTPVHDNLSSTDHVDDDLLGGGTEFRGPAVIEGYFYESWFFSHFPPEMFERVIVSHCRDTSCIHTRGHVNFAWHFGVKQRGSFCIDLLEGLLRWNRLIGVIVSYSASFFSSQNYQLDQSLIFFQGIISG